MPYQEKLIMHRALAFAAQAHHGQMRKGTDVPYIMHPFETAQILTKAGYAVDSIFRLRCFFPAHSACPSPRAKPACTCA